MEGWGHTPFGSSRFFSANRALLGALYLLAGGHALESHHRHRCHGRQPLQRSARRRGGRRRDEGRRREGCMEERTEPGIRAAGLQRSNRNAGFPQRLHSKFEPGSCYRVCNGFGHVLRVFSNRESRVSCVRGRITHTGRVHGSWMRHWGHRGRPRLTPARASRASVLSHHTPPRQFIHYTRCTYI